jgi:hypothetical protein
MKSVKLDHQPVIRIHLELDLVSRERDSVTLQRGRGVSTQCAVPYDLDGP